MPFYKGFSPLFFQPVSPKRPNHLKPKQIQRLFSCKKNPRSSAAQIDSWHRDRGFHLGIGYHYVIRRNGEIEPGRPEWMIGAHCHVKGHHYNTHSIGICYEGGLDARGQPADTRTAAQKKMMRQLLEDLHQRYPRAMIVGHRDLSHDRDCPCFDAYKEYLDLQPK